MEVKWGMYSKLGYLLFLLLETSPSGLLSRGESAIAGGGEPLGCGVSERFQRASCW